MDKVGAVYYYRRVVPDELRAYFKTANGKPRAEFKISLKTKDRRTADERLEVQAIKVSALLNEARATLAAGITPGSAAIDQSALQAWEAEQEAIRKEGERDQNQRDYAAEEFAQRLLAKPSSLLTRDEQAAIDLMPPEWKVPEPDYIVLRREADWIEGGKKAAESLAAGSLGRDHSYPNLRDLFEKYLQVTNAAPATAKAWRRFVEHLIRFVGHDDASRLTVDAIRKWKDFLLSGEGKPRTAKTVRDGYLTAIKAILNVAIEDGLISQNPVAGIKVRFPKANSHRERKGFEPEEAQTILAATLLAQSANVAPQTALARRWVPWVCAYTGARVNEITQLREKDICKLQGVWVIRITPEAGRVKNRKVRTVPLHPHLIEQGFHKLAAPRSETPLFYAPDRNRGGSDENPHYKKVGERLAAWVRAQGVTDPEVAPNHGWRHLFRTRAQTAGIPEAAIEWMMGHTPSSDARSYGEWTIPALKTQIDKLPYFK